MTETTRHLTLPLENHRSRPGIPHGRNTDLTSMRSGCHRTDAMKRMRAIVCILLAALLPGLPLAGSDLPAEKAELVRTGMTLSGAVLGLAAGTAIALDLSLNANDTPLSTTLLLAIPVAAAAATAAIAGRWVAEATLARSPSLLFSPIAGAGLGMLGGAFVGGISFSLAFAIAIPNLDVPEGYWGFDYPKAVGMAFLAGAFWGGLAGIPIGAVSVPIISWYMDF